MEYNWVLCIKYGTKYSSEYVNKLYSMCVRNSTIPFKFACITEDSEGLDSKIHIIDIPGIGLTGWWFKLWTFSKDLPITGTILFMDLDIVIVNNIDKIWNYKPSEFCIIQDFIRYKFPYWEKYNSSVYRFKSHEYTHIWENFEPEFINIFNGDQDWIYEMQKNVTFFPKEWIQSYKWEIRNKADLIKIDNKQLFKNNISPNIPSETAILVFHGEPKPENVTDEVILQNWL